MPDSSCCKKRCAIATAAAFVAIFAFNWVYHGHFLKPLYEATAALWRTHSEMESLMGLCILRQFVEAGIIVFIFKQNYENKGLMEGFRFGLLIGLLLGIQKIGAYVFMPIPSNLAIAWFAGEVIKGILVGIVLAITYRKAEGK